MKILIKLKKLLPVLVIVFLLVSFADLAVNAEEDPPVNVYFYWSKTCPHCAREKEFLREIIPQYPQVELKSYEVSKNPAMFRRVAKYFGNDHGYVPFTVVGHNKVVGFSSRQETGSRIRSMIETATVNGCPDVVAGLMESGEVEPTPPAESCTHQETPFDDLGEIDLPFFGQISPSRLSLPVLSIVIGLLDGFNPCAMWCLLFLISLLLGVPDATRRWVFGIAFIITSALIYFVFMTAWLNLFLFLGYVDWIRVIVGVAAVAIAIYSLRDYWVNRQGGCEVVDVEKKRKVFGRLRDLVEKRNFWIGLLGICLLAVAVNMVELICSAGLPAVYTHVLSRSNLETWQYYSHLAIYIFFFMLDDLVVFAIAMLTLHAVGIESKYARYSRLLGGILILIIGLLLLLRPGWLSFT